MVYRFTYDKLVGGIPTPLNNMNVNGKDYPFILWKITNVGNHQPENTGN